jgi:hypothetical protein
MRRWEDEKMRDDGIRNWECGLRPIGAYAYAPVGMRKIKAESEGRDRR